MEYQGVEIKKYGNGNGVKKKFFEGMGEFKALQYQKNLTELIAKSFDVLNGGVGIGPNGCEIVHQNQKDQEVNCR
ncbi:MAG: hypothetical protein ACOYKE_13175 [Ferruginibacter sp.]